MMLITVAPSLCFGKRRGGDWTTSMAAGAWLKGGKTSAPLGGVMSTGAASCSSLAGWKQGPCREHQLAALGTILEGSSFECP